jgi:hypothetical protein
MQNDSVDMTFQKRGSYRMDSVTVRGWERVSG